MSEFSLKKRLLTAIACDLALLAIGLLTFAYFHHVRVRNDAPTAIPAAVRQAAATATPAPPTVETEASPATENADAAAVDASTSDTSGMFGGQFADKFVAGEPVVAENRYQSQNVSVTVEQKTYNRSTYYFADIYVRDISCFRTAVALDYKEYNEGARKNCMQVPQLSELTDAIVAISGDNYVFRNAGVLAVRNGLEWANKEPLTDDICILYYDGTVETFFSKSAAVRREYIERVYEKGPYQIWCFGPSLLDENGQIPKSYNSSVSDANPRSAFGYYEPGHYCFLLGDGRQAGYSIGLTLAEMSEIFSSLGCKVAYNLDGGDTVAMTFRGALVNRPEESEPRAVSDILYIGEPIESAGAETEG